MTRSTSTAIVVTGLVGAWLAVATTAATPDAQRRPTFAADIAPIVLTQCATCHRPGQAAPFSLLSYDEVQAKGKDIVQATQSRRMPPWHAAQGPGFPALRDDRRLSDRQIAALKTWVDNGMPSGDLKRTPALPTFSMPWPLGLPDVTFALPRAVAVAGGGSDEHRNVVIEVGIPAELWLNAIDYQSSSSILKHVRFFIAPPDVVVADSDGFPGVAGLLGRGSLENYSDQVETAGRALIDLGGWVPGLARRLLPDGLAMRLPPRSNIVMQLHLKPGAEDAVEDGRLALYYSKDPTSRRALIPLDVPAAFGFASGLAIPAGAARHVVTDTFTLPVDVEAVGARGHAHHLAREMTMSATLPDGKSRGLLKLMPWDVDWPDSYLFGAPVRLPKGTTLRVEIVYDNSAGNPRNLFSPPRPVGWGRIGVGEMGSMSLLIVEPASAGDAARLAEARAQSLRQQLLKGGRR